MPTVNLTVTQGSDPVDPWVQALEDAGPWLEPVAQILEDDIGERFATRTDPWGAAWAPLSPLTLQLRSKGVGKRSSGRIAASPRWELREQGRRVVVFLAAGVSWWAKFHQTGVQAIKVFGRGSATLPARPFMPLVRGAVTVRDAIRTEIREAALEGLRRAVRARGGGRQ